MLIFLFGTTGELIKISPLVRAASKENIEVRLYCTGQQFSELDVAFESMNLDVPITWLVRGFRGHSLHRKREVLAWIFKTLVATWWALPKLRTSRQATVLVVHGDTLTTMLGALVGRLMRVNVAHVEAGMRSGRLLDPFPEEISRRFVGRLASVHYAPGLEPAQNLVGKRGAIVNTQQNTVVDALRFALSLDPSTDENDRKEDCSSVGLISIHRSELYEDRELLSSLIKLLRRHVDQTDDRLVFISHPVTMEKLRQYVLLEDLTHPRVMMLDKLPYYDFIKLQSTCDFIVTDSGGLQQECAETGQPCLVHRRVTETLDGLGENILLSEMNPQILETFLLSHDSYRRPAQDSRVSPTAIIMKDLKQRYFSLME